MAPEVRTLAPRTLGILVLALPLVFSLSVNAQEKQEVANKETKAEKKEASLDTKAQLLQDLDKQVEQRRAEISREEEQLAAMKSALEAVKRELQQERERMEALKRDVEAAIARREKVINERLTSIAKVYQSMKPKEAASAIADMDDDMAVAILERLPSKNVAKMFDTMPKDRVRVLTRRMEEGRIKRE
jgi:flagellar motility protein MotE (MotC chaperone)